VGGVLDVWGDDGRLEKKTRGKEGIWGGNGGGGMTRNVERRLRQ